jgi:hypothetical protein
MVDELNMNVEKVENILTRLHVETPLTVPICPPKAPHVTEHEFPR